MTVYADNPAGRLHALVSAFRRAQGSRDDLAVALKVTRGDNDGLLRRFAQVFSLPDDILKEVEQVDESNYDRDLALRWQRNLTDIIGETLFWGEKDPTASAFSVFLSSLEYCSYVLHRYRSHQMPLESDVERIDGLISELLDELQEDSPLDDDLRSFLLVHTRAMKDALDGIAVRGLVSLQEEFDRAVGALARRPDLAAKSDANPSAWKKFGDLLVAVAAVLQISTSAFVLPSQILQEIEGPRPTQVEVVQPKAQTSSGDQRDRGDKQSVTKGVEEGGTSRAP